MRHPLQEPPAVAVVVPIEAADRPMGHSDTSKNLADEGDL
jgi:hypothetical protein